MPEETELRPTPEMDAIIAADSGGGDFIKALVDKGKQLERQRDEARAETDRLAVSLAEALGWKRRWSADEDSDGWYHPGSETPEELPELDILVSALGRQRDRLLGAVSLALRTNGGPIDGADTLNGEAYVMVRACAFADLEAATAEVEGRR